MVHKHFPAILSFAVLTVMVGGSWFFPAFQKFYTLQYPVPDEPGKYYSGVDDLFTTTFFVFFWTLIRHLLIYAFFRPLGTALGIKKRVLLAKFGECGWYIIYSTFSFVWGFWLFYNSDYYFSPMHFWIGYPHSKLETFFKWNYICELGFWIHCVFALITEVRKKDFYQMLTHHFVTISLISVSLMGNFTRIGNAILVCQSFADIFLPLAKVFGYVQMGSTRDKIFIIFVVAWIVSRQIWLPIMVYSVWADLPVVVGFNYDPTVGHFLSYNLWLFLCDFLDHVVFIDVVLAVFNSKNCLQFRYPQKGSF